MLQLSPQRHVTLFALITALCLVGDSMLYIVLPMQYTQAGLSSLWEVGIILSVNRLVRLPLNPCIGFVYRHISEKTGIIIAVLLSVITTALYGLADSFTLWLVARMLWGLAWTLLRLGSLFCILRVATQDNRGQLNGLYNGLYRLGSLVGMLAGGILADLTDLTATAVFFSLLSGTAIIPALICIPKGGGGQQQITSSLAEGLAAMCRSYHAFRLTVTGILVAFVTQGVIAATLSPLIASHLGNTVTCCSLIMGATTLAGVVQALRWGWEPWLAPVIGILADRRFGWVSMLRWSLAATALTLFLVALPLPPIVWLVSALGMQLACTAITTLSETAASAFAAHDGGRAFLMQYALMVDVGAALGPVVAYGITASFGINWIYILTALCFCAYTLFWRRNGQPSI